MRTMKTIGVTAIVVFYGMGVSADTVSGSSGNAFRTWSAGNLDRDGRPYWDTRSLDGDRKNIGYALSGHPDVGLPSFPGAIPFWGKSFNQSNDTGGGADLNWFLNRTGGGSIASLRLEISSHALTNEFGWYDVSSPLVLHPLFGEEDSAVTEEFFDASSQYGFYIKDLRPGGGTFFTQSALNPSGEQEHQHFSIFRESSPTSPTSIYWIGIEDLTLAVLAGREGGKGDYNDMIIRIESIPESSTLAMMLIGLVALSSWISRRMCHGLVTGSSKSYSTMPCNATKLS